jgi:deoxyribodipyrimidine photo-lyase
MNWHTHTPPSRSAALQRAAAVRPHDYARSRNHLDGAVTGLSPYLTHGLLTLPEALAAVLQHGPLPVDHKLVYEFGWRDFYRHVWATRGDGILQSLHDGPLPEGSYARELPADVRQARTGVTAIDQAVRTLYATGTLHNHARMWLASYLVHLRRVHWRAGADWLVAHLLDGDIASNHLSWQWVAGTGSAKPYVFNAENVAKYAPEPWHSPGSVVDQSYEALDAIARGGPLPQPPRDGRPGVDEPALWPEPPADLSAQHNHLAEVTSAVAGRTVWLVHPWALRPPPGDLPADTLVLGVYLREHHSAWPWPEARWRWVDAAMASVAPLRVLTDTASLAHALQSAREVHSVADPHIAHWLAPLAQLAPEPSPFPQVDRPCSSFSQWWKRAVDGLQAGSGNSFLRKS